MNQPTSAPPSSPLSFDEFVQLSGFAQLCASRWPAEWQQLQQRQAWDQATPALLSATLDHFPLSDFSQQLRRWRQFHGLRIAWRDISGQADFIQTCRELSALADACQQQALDHAQQALEQRFGALEPACSFCVIALGKLGAGELNFSSDIDVMFVYQGRGQTQGRRTLETAEFFTKLAQDWIGLLDRITEYGQVYRVDTRLRPFGRAGALCWSLAALEDYYQREGRDWERFAWLRARPVAGDLALGEQLISALRPFVFRRYLDYGLFEGVRTIRGEIERESQRQGRQDHLKLGPGGIRELEFLVQSHQVLRGGQQTSLRQRSTLGALQACVSLGLIPADQGQQLSAAYVHLRTLENRLQMLDDQQVHELPRTPEQRQRLAQLLGMDWQQLVHQLQRHQALVQEHFHQLFQEPTRAGADWAALSELKLEASAAQQRLTELGFEGQRAWQLLEDHHQALQRLPLSHEARQRLAQFRPRLLQVISQRQADDRLLQHCLDLVLSVARRSAYLALLWENPAALERMVDLFARSDTIFTWVREQPSLLDELIAPSTPPADVAQIEQRLGTRLLNVDDGERQQEILARSQRSLQLNTAISELSAAAPQAVSCALNAQRVLSDLAAAVIRCILRLQEQVAAAEQCGFAVIGYGALGAREMRYGSDLDLVFLYDSQRLDERSATRLARRLIHWLSTPGPAGRLYPIDTRLRPNGGSGLLVSSIKAFGEYQQQHAWTWELQALARARGIAGDSALIQSFEQIRRARLSQPREPAALWHDISQMREKMRASLGQSANYGEARLKHGHGGLVDIQFLAQYWQLCYCPQDTSLVQHSNTLALLQALSSSTPLTPQERSCALQLSEYWQSLVQWRHACELSPRQASREADQELLLAQAATLTQAYFQSGQPPTCTH